MASNKFISIEGSEGAGKSTSIDFIRKWFSEHQIEPVMTREPGGTPLAEEIRELLLEQRDESVHPDTELLLMYASRVQHCEETIKPALAAGHWVISDRFNDASFAYQGTAREMSLEHMTALDQWALGDFKPDHTLFLDVPVEIGLERAGLRSAPDRFEQESMDFFHRVREGYHARAKADPERFIIIDASVSIPEVEAQLRTALEQIISG